MRPKYEPHTPNRERTGKVIGLGDGKKLDEVPSTPNPQTSNPKSPTKISKPHIPNPESSAPHSKP
jgi:hypothetical protein